MGTDIHGRLQRRWNAESEYHDVGEIERDRNYRVFAMLAGVRNGFGFAGVKTHEPLEPISAPRGLPDDLRLCEDDQTSIAVPTWIGDESVEVRHWLGYHSYSWLTLSEILSWDGWGKTLHMTGILDADEFQRVETEGCAPRSWCGAISGRDTVTVTAEQARAGAKHTNVQYEWEVPFAEYVKTFRAWIDYINAKYGYMLERDPGAIRLVFGFDS